MKLRPATTGDKLRILKAICGIISVINSPLFVFAWFGSGGGSAARQERSMKGNNKVYHVTGNKKIGYRLIIPQIAMKSEQVSDKYLCHVKRNGTLVYQPVRP